MICDRHQVPIVQEDCPLCNPHRLRDGDWVILPDGSTDQIRRAGMRLGRMVSGRTRVFPLNQLTPVTPKAPEAAEKTQLNLFEL